mmetsp:Transcript_29036/g.81816  ORF Transcript_29036/g.81816 Transcript_29036/m.81816 type:complete len:319 (+) Transcript_29036:1540-2496(+)
MWAAGPSLPPCCGRRSRLYSRKSSSPTSQTLPPLARARRVCMTLASFAGSPAMPTGLRLLLGLSPLSWARWIPRPGAWFIPSGPPRMTPKTPLRALSPRPNPFRRGSSLRSPSTPRDSPPPPRQSNSTNSIPKPFDGIPTCHRLGSRSQTVAVLAPRWGARGPATPCTRPAAQAAALIGFQRASGTPTVSGLGPSTVKTPQQRPLRCCPLRNQDRSTAWWGSSRSTPPGSTSCSSAGRTSTFTRTCCACGRACSTCSRTRQGPPQTWTRCARALAASWRWWRRSSTAEEGCGRHHPFPERADCLSCSEAYHCVLHHIV